MPVVFSTPYKVIPAEGWDISNASFVQTYNVSAQNALPRGVSFKTDGTKMFMLGLVGDTVYEYNLLTPWDISSATFNQSKSVTAQEGAPEGLTFRPDGTNMFITGGSGQAVVQYDLSPAWDISTATLNQQRGVSGQDNAPQAMEFNSDGTKMFVLGATNRSVYEYTMTAWNVNTASFVQSFSVNTQETNPSGLAFKDDGTAMFVVGPDSDNVHEYTLPTPWSLTGATHNQSVNISAQETIPRGLTFKTDGLKMYVAGHGGTGDIHEYDL